MKADFIALLKETDGLNRDSRWSETKKKIDSDPRYKAVDSSSRREDWFYDYIKRLSDVSFPTYYIIACKLTIDAYL